MKFKSLDPVAMRPSIVEKANHVQNHRQQEYLFLVSVLVGKKANLMSRNVGIQEEVDLPLPQVRCINSICSFYLGR